MIYAFIHEHAEHSVTRWAAFFEVSTSGYYDWLKDQLPRRDRQEEYDRLIRIIFEASGGTYGAERVCAQLRAQGHTASFARVKRAMNRLGLHSVHVRRVRALTDSRKARGDGYSNLMRGMEVTQPFQALSSDISYIPTDEGFLYLCQIIDIKTNLVLAHMTSDRMTKELVLDTIRAAHKRYRLPQGVIFHSDRGSQYTAGDVMALLARLGFRQSFSRVGMPGDNAWSESFFSILKKEAVHPVRFGSREQAGQVIFRFIEAFYNRTRIQRRLGFLSPVQCIERAFLASQKVTA